MDFFKRLFSIGTKSKPKSKSKLKDDKSKQTTSGTRNTNLLTPTAQYDPDAMMNRLLRSSSTHFSVLSETEYTNLPPIPHPINNILRAPSVMSSTSRLSTSSYTVTIQNRTLHSCTEFPNANGRITPPSSVPNTPARRSKSIPPLTPGDRNRLLGLRQDASVLSLLNIYDDAGQPAPEAFSNTPATKRQRTDSTLRMLLGETNPPSSAASRTSVEESDLSWAERCIANAENIDSATPSSSDSSLEMPDNLFKRLTSPEQAETSCYSIDSTASIMSSEANIDSLQVELGTIEGGSIVLKETVSMLTSPAQGAPEFFKFLEGKPESPSNDDPLNVVVSPGLLALPRSPMISALKSVTNSPHGPRPMKASGTSLYLRDGPKETQTQLSPAPRRRQDPPPLPPIPPDFHFRSPNARPPRLEHRSPAIDVRPNRENSNTRVLSDTAASVASSIYPEVEVTMDTDPYTPVPKRIGFQKRGRNDLLLEDNSPTRAPFRGRVRKYPEYAQSHRNKENAASELPSPKRKRQLSPESKEQRPYAATPSTLVTPIRHTPFMFQTPQAPVRPSPPSSTELSPEGRHIMATVRAEKQKFDVVSNIPLKPVWRTLAETLDDTMQ